MPDYPAVASNFLNAVGKGGLSGAKWFLRRMYYKARAPEGTPIYGEEWDVLVILDACRADLMREVAPNYDFIGTVDTFNSLGSSSQEWLRQNFTEEHADDMARTAYISSNAYTDEKLQAEDFQHLDEVWRYAWDDELGTVPPRPVSDRAIMASRELSPDRLIVHYLQPHIPFIGAGEAGKTALDEFGGGKLDSTWDDLEAGRVSQEDFWEMYEQNLEYVLDDVELILNNIDADTVVISADHGNAIGEKGVYGHSGDFKLPCLYEVPWCVTSAVDSGEYEPGEYDSSQTNTQEEQLEALGYK